MTDPKMVRHDSDKRGVAGIVLALLCRFFWLWLQKRMNELLPIALGHRIANDAIRIWPFGFRQMMRAKQPVINRKMAGVIDINRRAI